MLSRATSRAATRLAAAASAAASSSSTSVATRGAAGRAVASEVSTASEGFGIGRIVSSASGARTRAGRASARSFASSSSAREALPADDAIERRLDEMLAEKKTRPTGSPPFTHAASLATTKRATTTTSTSTSSSPLAVSASFDVEEPETLADEDTARVDQRATQVRACFVGANIDIGAIEKEMPTHKKEKLADCVVITLQPPLPPGLAAAMEAAGGRGNKEGDGGAGAQTTKKAAAAAAGQVTPAHVEPPLIYRRADRLGLGKKRSPLFDASGQLSGSPLTYDVGATRYFVVYKYGSVVFFNVGRREREQCLKLARKYCPKACEGSGSTDEINVFVRPSLEDTYAFDDKVLVVKGLDINNVSVVGEVLAQSVALHFHEERVNTLIEECSVLNKETGKSGKMQIEKKRLFKLVADVNETLTEVSTRIGINSRSETVWKYEEYDKAWSVLRKDFELVSRFESLDYKLNIIQSQVKFYLELLANQKSDFLEWTIIVLIAMEICVSLYDIFERKGGGIEEILAAFGL